MTCRDAQPALSLYLYGELDFAAEERLETHLAECAACQLALAREKQWHTLASGQVSEPPLDLLSECRREFRPALARQAQASAPAAVRSWWRWSNPFDISTNRWSGQIALASFLVFLGFSGARFMDRGGFHASGLNEMGVLNPANTLIRDIRPGDGGTVHIVVDQPREISGRLDDATIRSLLLSGARQPEAAVRFYSVQMLGRETDKDKTADFRQVLLDVMRSDPNPAVRLQAIEGVRSFSSDPEALSSIKFVLQHDDNPGVRYQAINILAPTSGAPMPPAVTETIEEVLLTAPDDDYLRARCSQALQAAKVPVVY